MVELNASSYSCNEASSFGSFGFEVNDDDVVKIPTPDFYGHFLIASNGTQDYGLFWFRSNAIVKCLAGTTYETASDTALTGTTGTDDKVTISTNDGNLYIENRTGAKKEFSITFIGLSKSRLYH